MKYMQLIGEMGNKAKELPEAEQVRLWQNVQCVAAGALEGLGAPDWKRPGKGGAAGANLDARTRADSGQYLSIAELLVVVSAVEHYTEKLIKEIAEPQGLVDACRDIKAKITHKICVRAKKLRGDK